MNAFKITSFVIALKDAVLLSLSYISDKSDSNKKGDALDLLTFLT